MIFRQVTHAALVLPLFALLASCATVERVIRPPLVIPPTLLTCADYPVEPSDPLAPDFDVQVAVFMVRSEDAWRDCRDTIADVAGLIEQQGGD